MKPHFRIQLPELRSLTESSFVKVMQVDGSLNKVRTEQVSLKTVASLVRSARVYVLLASSDAVVADIKLPPLPRARLHEAVVACVEPMILGRLDSILVAHTNRDPETGMLQVAWTDRQALLKAWRLLLELGLRIKAIMPGTEAVSVDTDKLDGAGDGTGSAILSALPDWSFTLDQEQPTQGHRTSGRPVIWSVVAACIWILGLNLYAMRLSHEAGTLEKRIETSVKADFPEIPVLLDPVIQAQRQLSRLEQKFAGTSADLFAKLILDTHALLPFSATRVRALEYQEAQLTITLASATDAVTQDAFLSLTSLNNEAARRGLVIVHDRSEPSRWQISRLPATSPDETTARSARP